ncbi:tetratricopeptide repeat protein [Paludibacter sp.]
MRIRFLFIAFNLCLIAFAQSPNEAEALFNSKKYVEAGRIYSALLSKKPNDPLNNYRYARCCYEAEDYETAIKHFLNSGTRYPLRDYYLADSYFYLYKFTEALEYFDAYAASATVNQTFMNDVNDKIRRSQIANRLINRVEEVELIDSTSVSKNDFFSLYKLGRESGNISFTKATIANKRVVDLFSFVTQRGDRKIFTKINGNNTDIFSADKLLDVWSNEVPISNNINTAADENYPFLMLDGITLFFASNNENSIGGYDIFMTRFNSNTNDYLLPDNIGMPFSSIYNDYLLVIDEGNDVGWFVSDRNRIHDKVTVYQFKYNETKKFVSTDDSKLLIEYAQLKKFKKVKQKVVNKEEDFHIPATEIQNTNTVFQINDTIVYTNSNQFRSYSAQNLWHEWFKMNESLNEKETLLSSLRNAYALSEDEKERKELKDEITNLEEYVLKLRITIPEKVKEIRNLEINYLKQHS